MNDSMKNGKIKKNARKFQKDYQEKIGPFLSSFVMDHQNVLEKLPEEWVEFRSSLEELATEGQALSEFSMFFLSKLEKLPPNNSVAKKALKDWMQQEGRSFQDKLDQRTQELEKQLVI